MSSGAVPENEMRYSPACCIGCDLKAASGNPAPSMSARALLRRQNVAMRMSVRRFTRLTNAGAEKYRTVVAALNGTTLHGLLFKAAFRPLRAGR